jgi:GT2 family glycosyltransferase
MVVPIFNGIKDTIEFLQSVSNITYNNYEIVIVDDGSTDGSGQIILEKYPYVHVLKGDGNLWWAGATNLGVRDALTQGTDFILTINNDNEVSQNFLDCLVESALKNPGCIIKSVGYDYEERGNICSFGGEIVWWKGGIEQVSSGINLHDRIVEVSLANGNSTLFPIKVFSDVGLFDEINCPQYHADSELLLKARQQGYRILVDTGSMIYNKSDKSVGGTMTKSTNIVKLLFDRRSPYYFRANYKIYKNYCPFKIYLFFLCIRYYFMLKNIVKRFAMSARQFGY